jgi:signal transduction histidine kinase
LLAYGRPAEPEQSPLPLSEAVDAAIRDNARLSRERGVRVQVTGAEALPLLTHDPRLLAQALRNLLDNAIQHAPPGGVVDVVSGRGRGTDGEYLTLTVRDRGPGFSPEELARAGEPFFTRRRGGTGLGLAIARRIVESHGGALRLANRDGGGCEAVIQLPLPAEQNAG